MKKITLATPVMGHFKGLFKGLFIGLVVAAVCGFGNDALAQSSATASSSISTGISTSVSTRIERHPMLRKAIRALERAKDDLNDAAHDFCGHRADALGATDAALGQMKLALECNPGKVGQAFKPAQGKPGNGKYPNIHRAINALRSAKTDLQDASHDFCGHRVEALQTVNTALTQLQQAIKCASQNQAK